MWPFSKKLPPKIPKRPVSEVVVFESYPLKDCDPYEITVGISHCEDEPDSYRVFYKLRQPHWSDLTVYPRQQMMPRSDAIEVAEAWAEALRVTYQVGLKNFKVEE